MKKLFTLIVLSSIALTAWAQQGFFDIPLTNPDLEANVPFVENEAGNEWRGEGWLVWAFPGGNPEYVGDLTGLAPGEGVDGSQAVRVQQTRDGAGTWHTLFKSEFIDIRPTGAGQYIMSYSIKADTAITEEKVGSEHFIWCTFALKDKDGGPLGGTAFGPMMSYDDQFILHEGYLEVTDTIDIPAEATHSGSGNSGPVAYLEFNIQLAKHSGSYLFDNFSLRGPESFYDITFEVYGILDGDTAALAGAEVIFDDLDYTTDENGMVTVPDLKGATYDWSVGAAGYSTKSGTKPVSKFETIPIYLTEVVLGTESPKISTSIYPNPTNQSVRIVSEDSKLREIKILSLSGSVMMNKKMNSSVIDLDVSNYPSGIYFLNMVNDKNEMFSERLVISE